MLIIVYMLAMSETTTTMMSHELKNTQSNLKEIHAQPNVCNQNKIDKRTEREREGEKIFSFLFIANAGKRKDLNQTNILMKSKLAKSSI